VRKAMKDKRTRAICFSSHSLRHSLPRICSIKAMTHHQGTFGTFQDRDDHDLFAPSAKKRATLCSPLDFFIKRNWMSCKGFSRGFRQRV
jgi:hypothetical protein